jgi:4a-hydroxytetrahydrobiopterin dehydratase
MSALKDEHCVPLRGAEHLLEPVAVSRLLTQLPGWVVDDSGAAISKKYRFADYGETIAFVNAVAAVAVMEDHHPDLEVGYDRCLVRYNTHDVGGLSRNDFICAAKVEALAEG